MPDAYLQAGALAIVFVGYVIGWKKEMLGGVLAVLGTIAFYIVNLVVFHAPPLPEAALLAVPGIFYMLAQGVEEHPGGGVRESHEH